MPSLRSALALLLLLLAPLASARALLEYYHAGFDHYFVTADPGEIRDLDTGVHAGWQRTGQVMQVFDPGDPRLADSIPVCRFYGNPELGLDSHFYSATPQECEAVKQRFPDAWRLESNDVFRVHAVTGPTGSCPAGTRPAYRLYNNRADANHRYTTDLAVVETMRGRGYVLEGVGSPLPVVFCTADTGGAPGTGPLACSLSASSTTPMLGTAMTLTATCTGGPTRYEWLVCAPLTPDVCVPLPECASAREACSPAPSQPGPALYAVRAANATGTSAKATVQVIWNTFTAPPVPACSVSAFPTSPVAGSPLTLSASCTNDPTSFAWTNCAGTGATCTVSEATPGPRTYTVTGSNAAGSGNPASVSVNWQPRPTAAPACTLTASPATPYAGGAVLLTANCTQSPTAWQWTGCTQSSGSTCLAARSTAGTVTYAVTAQNALGSSAPASVTVTWQPPPPPGADFCGSYAKIKRIDLPWGGIVNTNDPGGGWEDDAVLVARLQVPPTALGTTLNGLIRIVEFVDAPAERLVTLSPSACDFRGFQPGLFPPTDPTGAAAPMAWSYGVSPAIGFALAGMPGAEPKLIPGQVYYLNLRNVSRATGQPSCTTEECNVRINVSPPG